MQSGRPKYFNEGEVWWCHLGQNIGDEENGKHPSFKRPVFILRKFNKNLALVVPTSTKLKPDNKWYIPFSYQNNEYSLLVSHLRTIDTKRLEKKIAELKQEQVTLISTTIQDLIFR